MGKVSKSKTKFKNLSLKKKLLLFYSILFIFPLILISILIYLQVSQIMLEKVKYSAKQSYEQAKSYLEYKLLLMIQRTDVVVMNTSLVEMLQEENAIHMNPFQQMSQREWIRSYLQSVEGNQDIRLKIYVDDKFLYTPDGKYIFPLSIADESKWYEKKESKQVYFVPGEYLEEELHEQFIALIRDVNDQNSYNERNGVLRMDIDINILEEILHNATPTENAVSYLINQDDNILALSNVDKLRNVCAESKLPKEFLYSKYADESDLKVSKLEDKTVYFIQAKIKNTDWEMITIIPKKDMVSGIARLQYIVAAMMILFAILTIVGGTVIVSWIVRRISRLVDSINEVKDGNLDVFLENDYHDEIGVLYNNYNEMIFRTNELLKEKYKMGSSLKSAELKALQSQINPHFLYNTLDMINWLAYAGRTEDIHHSVLSLSRYYRLILNKGKDTLTLEEELLHVKYYMKIQDIRYPGKISYNEEVEDEIKGVMVPKIILQPLVENAIQHGILEKHEKKGTIWIKAKVEKVNVICVQIIDDGIGMDKSEISQLINGNIKSSGSSYGIKNVDARIRLMFGENYGLTYESVYGVGTTVYVRFSQEVLS